MCDLRLGRVMWSGELGGVQRLKISCFSRGIRIEPDAARVITKAGTVPLTIHEYSTTGGVTLELEGEVYINAPFDDWYTGRAVATLAVDKNREFVVRFGAEEFSVVRVLPLPGYLGAHDSRGRPVSTVAMSHADRVRLSPIRGCVYSCHFCDLPSEKYVLHPVGQIVEALRIALEDTSLPPRHVMVSGGSPGPKHHKYFEDVCRAVLKMAQRGGDRLPVDIMMSPWRDDGEFVDRMVDAGLHGFSLNIELYGDVGTVTYLSGKSRAITRQGFERFLERAVTATGGDGRVRSLILVGLEPPDLTLRGVEYLAQRGCDPVLSPFRPARNTRLDSHPPPSPEELERVYLESIEIVERHGVRLGPRCIPCQHNTLTFPDDARERSMAASV